MQKNVEFYSENNLLKGVLYYPPLETNRLYPAIILCHGFAGVKELLLPAFAKKFSDNGFIVLTFDYSGFGESEGEKGKIAPYIQITDIRNAISFLQNETGVDHDRIGLWGTSYGGANAITVTALDHRVKCLIAQLTFGDGERTICGNLNIEEKEKLFESINKAWIRKVTKNKELYLPLDKVLSDEQSIVFYNQNVDQYPALKTKIPFLTLKETMSHKPELFLTCIHVPFLIVAAENDKVNPREESCHLYDLANDPKELYIVKNASHYDIYSGPKFDEVSNHQLEWFKKYL